MCKTEKETTQYRYIGRGWGFRYIVLTKTVKFHQRKIVSICMYLYKGRKPVPDFLLKHLPLF